eukprot:NODE_785_length_4266_cov_0.433405.p2 type:complete len:276 gc:universal NODE_785_length_4266_cov_0.433405:3799-2972(-)
MELLDDSFWQNLYEDEQQEDINDYWTFDTPIEEHLDIGYGYQLPMERVAMENYLQTQLDEPLVPDVLEVVKAMVSPFVGDSDELDLKCLDYSTLCDLYHYMQSEEQRLEEAIKEKLEAKKKGVRKKKQSVTKKKKIVEGIEVDSPCPSVEESLFLDNFDLPDFDMFEEQKVKEASPPQKTTESKKKRKKKVEESIPIQTPVKQRKQTKQDDNGPQIPIVPIAFPRIRSMGGYSPFGTMNHCAIPVTPYQTPAKAQSATASIIEDIYEDDDIDIVN